MSISVKNGEATIDGPTLYGIFLGSTCPEGLFPPVGLLYSTFTFKPKAGTSGVLVFKKMSTENSYDFWPYFWEHGKLVIQFDHQYLPTNPFSTQPGSGHFGLMIQYRNRIFVTNIPKDAGEVEYRLVDAMSMVQFIDGKIDRRQLARAAQVVKATAVRNKSLKDQLFALQQSVGRLDGQNSRLTRELEEATQKIHSRDVFLWNLRLATQLKWGWLLRLVIGKTRIETLNAFDIEDRENGVVRFY